MRRATVMIRAVLLLLAMAVCLQSAIQYAGGTNVNTTFTGDTRAAIANGIKTAIETAGWTVAAGGAGDWTMQSALTPENLQVQVRLYDPGAGNCARVSFRNVAGTKIGADLYLLPAALKTFRVIANRYTFWAFVPGSIVTREFVAGGTLALPSFLNTVITEAFWSQGNANTDADVTYRPSFRTVLKGSMESNLINGNLWSSTLDNQAGMQQILSQVGSYTDGNTLYTWHNGNYFLYDAILGFGLAAVADPAQARGYIYDAVITTAVLAIDSATTFDGHNWFSMIGTAGTTANAAGTILVVVP